MTYVRATQVGNVVHSGEPTLQVNTGDPGTIRAAHIAALDAP